MTTSDSAAAPVDRPRPDSPSGVAPYLTLSDASAAADFYGRAFGAVESGRMADKSGRVMHSHLRINGGSVMLSDGFPEHGHPVQTPQAFMLHLAVDDVDAWWARAVAAGAEVVSPLQTMFWGDRYGQLRDPFGVIWSMGAPAG